MERKVKRILAVFVSVLAVMCMPGVPLAAEEAEFSKTENVRERNEMEIFISQMNFWDVTEGDWYYDAVDFVFQRKIMTGLTEARFGPAETLARAQMAMILYRMEGSPQVQFSGVFPDVTENAWYSDAVLWANQAGIVTGYKDSGLFGPGDNITREQLAVMLFRYIEYKEMDVSKRDRIAGMENETISVFANVAVRWALAEGIITGDGGKINPQGTVNRAVCATMITRLYRHVLLENLEEGNFYIGKQKVHVDIPGLWKEKFEIYYTAGDMKNVIAQVSFRYKSLNVPLWELYAVSSENRKEHETDVYLGRYEGIYYYAGHVGALTWETANEQQAKECQEMVKSVTDMERSFCIIENDDFSVGLVYAAAYAQYLYDHQVGPTIQMPYPKGEGKFALAYITEDDIPELLVINIYGQAMLYTYDGGAVRELRFASGSTDISRYDYRAIRYIENGSQFFVRRTYNNYDGWKLYVPDSQGEVDFVLCAEACIKNANYYCNEYDVQRMIQEGYSYLKDFSETPVSAEVYENYIKEHNLNEAACKSIKDSDLRSITPQDIKAVFGY